MNDLFKGVLFVSEEEVIKPRVVASKSPVETFKEAVEKQIKLLEYDLKPTETKPEGRAWYLVKDGKATTLLRYSSMSFELDPAISKGQKALQVGKTHANLISWFKKLLTALNTGQYDDRIKAISDELKATRAAARAENVKKQEEAEKKAAEAIAAASEKADEE